MSILVTGASGFVGSPLVKELLNHKYLVLAVDRYHNDAADNLVNKEIDGETDWSDILEGVDVVIHLANRAHVMDEEEGDGYSAYKKTNVDGSLNLASQAINQGVRRFIYISSVKVNGEATTKPFNEEDKPCPQDIYGKSKYEAECVLKDLCKTSSMELVIIRPPIVYGPGVKGNFLSLLKFCNKNIPLPLGCANNKRSFIFVNNLVSFLELCITHPKAANNTFLISDSDDQSTTDLIKSIKTALNKSSFLWPAPLSVLVFLCKIIGKKHFSDRLFSSLQVDATKAKTRLDWQPLYSFEEGIAETVKSFKRCYDQKSF